MDDEGLLYPCVCTRKELELASSTPHPTDGTRVYPGTCRDRFNSLEQAREKSGREPALRLRCPEGTVNVEDTLFGSTPGDPSVIFGDYPVLRRDYVPAYQLAVVVDDGHQGINEVHRGGRLAHLDLRPGAPRRDLGLPRAPLDPFPTRSR